MAIRSGEQRRKQYEGSSAKRTSEAVPPRDSDLKVHETLARLPSHYRIVLEAKYLRGLSMNEIAVDSSASVEAIESLLRRARAGFAREYEQVQTFD